MRILLLIETAAGVRMEEFVQVKHIDQAVLSIQSQITLQPRVAMILGSGLGQIAERVENAVHIPFDDIPNWPRSTVSGHGGRLVIGWLLGVPVLVMKGRAHYYEGYSMSQIGLPIRVMQRMKMEALIVTNAAGAINPDFEPGDVMLISDHIAMVAMGGMNPLRGPNLDEFGPRFPDMSQPYDRRLISIAHEVAQEKQIALKEGVYAGLAGPSYETPADLRFLHTIGADAVGMSTVPEVIVANHGKLPVLGFSGISNKANLDGSTVTTHEEVLEAGKILVPKLSELILGVLKTF
jgi:purine-nucleoside phosphorylase